MKNNNKIMVLFDTEKEYAEIMGEYLKKNKTLGWDVHIYSDEEEFANNERSEDIALLLVSEKAYSERIGEIPEERLIILSEEGLLRNERVRYVDKYMRADDVLKEVLLIYLDIEGEEIKLHQKIKNKGTKLIGFYSPVHRCLQTGMAFTLGSMLAEEFRTLYLNFECYPGYALLASTDGRKDLSDLLYFMHENKERFILRLKTVVLKSGGLDYIPSMRTMQNLMAVDRTEWISLMEMLAESSEYDYIVLDLSEGVNGLFDVLKLCYRIFTVTEKDVRAESKLFNYEETLLMYECGDVKDRTVHIENPRIKRLPEDIGMYDKSELAEYIRRNIWEKCL
ncbi:MAG: hypothetical protein IJ608_11405 [Lachnospiraceae bacterium]|nr:hypothetical protein [Lachnospiraceae bacterium]